MYANTYVLWMLLSVMAAVIFSLMSDNTLQVALIWLFSDTLPN